MTNQDKRLKSGEAYMICNECGSKLWSFYGRRDEDRPCPYKNVRGECEPETQTK